MGRGVGEMLGPWILGVGELGVGRGWLIYEDVVDPVDELKECGSLCGVVGKAGLGSRGVPCGWW